MDKITVENLNLYYGDFHALKNINLNISPNEITAFIGPSGCGKSTLLKSLNRMNDLVPGGRIEGDVRLKGQDIFAREMELTTLRRRVGMVFQKPNPFPMSVYDNIAYGPRTHGVRKKAMLEENPLVRLTDQADEICRACPNNLCGQCESAEKVRRYDRTVLSLCGLTPGDVLPYRELAERVLAAF